MQKIIMRSSSNLGTELRLRGRNSWKHQQCNPSKKLEKSRYWSTVSKNNNVTIPVSNRNEGGVSFPTVSEVWLRLFFSIFIDSNSSQYVMSFQPLWLGLLYEFGSELFGFDKFFTGVTSGEAQLLPIQVRLECFRLLPAFRGACVRRFIPLFAELMLQQSHSF